MGVAQLPLPGGESARQAALLRGRGKERLVSSRKGMDNSFRMMIIIATLALVFLIIVSALIWFLL